MSSYIKYSNLTLGDETNYLPLPLSLRVRVRLRLYLLLLATPRPTPQLPRWQLPPAACSRFLVQTIFPTASAERFAANVLGSFKV